MFLSFSHHRFCVVFSSQPSPWMGEVYGIFNQNSKDKISLGRPYTRTVRTTCGIPDPSPLRINPIFSTRIKAENFFITNGPGEINFYVFYTISFPPGAELAVNLQIIFRSRLDFDFNHADHHRLCVRIPIDDD